MITYTLGRGLYVALTNRCNATPLAVTRGPGFKITSGTFAPLPEGFEPSAKAVVAEVQAALAAHSAINYDSVVFAGLGEPTLRLPDLLEISQVRAPLQSPCSRDARVIMLPEGIASHPGAQEQRIDRHFPASEHQRAGQRSVEPRHHS